MNKFAGEKMYLIKVLVSIILFISSLLFPLVIKAWGSMIYVGFFIPIILQKMWFGKWFWHEIDKQFWKNLLYSCLFIIASLGALDIFIIMAGIIEKTDYFIIPLILNRIFFFFAIIYLWNYKLLKEQNIIFSSIFRIIQIIYTLIAILFIALLLSFLATKISFGF